MIYILLGEDRSAKDEKIAAIKKKVFQPLESPDFDYEVLHAIDLDPATLKKSLLALPAVASQRLVMIREAHKLTDHHRKLILESLAMQNPTTVLILDTDEGFPQSFLKMLPAKAQVLRTTTQEVSQNVFDMTRAMASRQPQDALKILSGLLENGDHPLQIMGGLVWFWGKSKQRLPAQKFHQGLKHLQEADLQIKRSLLQPEYALEVAVVKLSSLLTS
jgi:DNA polymerase III delta subunit